MSTRNDAGADRSGTAAGLESNNRSPMVNTAFNSITLCLLEAPWWLAVLALIFVGPLIDFYGYAAALLIAGAVASMTITAYFSSWRGSIWKPQDVPTAILAIMSVEIVRSSLPGTSLNSLIVTILALIAISSVATGILFFFLGLLRLGNLVRYLPYPVIAGFLGGTGWLLLKAGADAAIGSQGGSGYWQPDIILRWSPALLLALSVWWLGRRYDHPLMLPGMLTLATLAFHVLSPLFGWSIDDWRAGNWMFSALTPNTESTALHLSDAWKIDWSILAYHSGSIAVLAAGSVISMLLNNSGFELQIGKDFDINKDLRVAGLANMAGGVFGGWPGYMSPGSSLINARQGQQLPATGLLVAIGAALIIWLGTPLLTLIPLFVFGCVVSYIGILFIAEWVFGSYRKLSRAEYLIVLSIVAGIAFFGLAQGVVFGLLLTVALLLFTMTRIDVVRHQLTGNHLRSRIKRSAAERASLDVNGSGTQVFVLQGYLFFGTANRLLEQIRTATNRLAVRFVVVDFERVSGVDSTAISSFVKLQRYATDHGIQLIFAALDANSKHLLRQQFISIKTLPPRFDESIDSALEWTENQLLAGISLDASPPGASLREYLQSLCPQPDRVDRLLEMLERRNFNKGDYLIKQDDRATELFFIEHGSVTAQIEHADGSSFRLESLSNGVVGELAFYLGSRRTAAVVCDNEVTALILTRHRLDSIERLHPEEASALHLMLAKLLSERSVHLIAQVDALRK